MKLEFPGAVPEIPVADINEAAAVRSGVGEQDSLRLRRD
jgi:hypothetical protein